MLRTETVLSVLNDEYNYVEWRSAILPRILLHWLVRLPASGLLRVSDQFIIFTGELRHLRMRPAWLPGGIS